MAVPPPPGLDLTETKVPTILGVSIATYILAIAAVVLRVLYRRMLSAKLWLDDYFMFVALLAGGGMLFVTDAWMVPHGLGLHVWTGPPDALLVWAHGLFIQEFFYTICLVTIKWSILCFYWRLFSDRRSIRLPICIVGGLVGAWGVAVLLVTIFQCLPVDAFWNKLNPAISPEVRATYRCDVNVTKFFIGISVPNFMTDLLILSLPIPVVWGLQMRTRNKIAVLGILMLGAFIVGVSITRFYYIVTLNLESPDITWNSVQGQLWSVVECYIGIVCGCLPSFGPLFSALSSTVISYGASKVTKRDPEGERYPSHYNDTYPMTNNTNNSIRVKNDFMVRY